MNVDFMPEEHACRPEFVEEDFQVVAFSDDKTSVGRADRATNLRRTRSRSSTLLINVSTLQYALRWSV